MTTLKEFFEANSYRRKTDNYPFTDDYETVLGIEEALISVKLWLKEKRERFKKFPDPRNEDYEEMLDILIEELNAGERMVTK